MASLDYQTLIDAAIVELTAINSTLLSLSANKRASYSIDTGQSKESVTAIRVAELRTHRDALISDIEFWTSMLDGSEQQTYTRPRF